ncbi:hypothetical protein N7462_005910 [Penicillium macrosclerotiorum]|uniref:uncharacterized protein n=1 Tax=Penicillium macrosclerotiorum TaxID=303699 RepID=UPI002547CE46|nr:uncharacterized protein N7462_005910 [Penicillium macrosclerotiorum]KAJ5682745.1 hypothetical protein N7462_005910 [Penicillium macrosclerotiorum]
MPETTKDKAAFEVIVLGPNGGPREDNVTGLLVRSTALNWSPGSVVAVDAGTLLAGIIRLLNQAVPKAVDHKIVNGPFSGLELPFKTAEANAAYIFRDIIGAVLITHPHLDHISGLAINTPILEAGNGPKPVAALPSVLAAIKNHMFNDIIWPNLSDEDGGAGLLTYQRLVEGGNSRLGSAGTRGYVRACNGLLTKCLSVSHGRSKQRYHAESGAHHGTGSAVFDQYMLQHRGSLDQSDGSSPRIGSSGASNEPAMATVESSAFFLQDNSTGNEIIVFGDVEPDTVALEPHNRLVWKAAAPKVAAGTLRAIFIECSYNDSIDDAFLYGHLCPRHLIAELKVLADKVMDVRDGIAERKPEPNSNSTETSPSTKRAQSATGARVSFSDSLVLSEELDQPDPARWAKEIHPPLNCLSVYIIHVKETLSDGPPPGERIIKELQAHSREAHLGCDFFLPSTTEPIWI